VILAVQRLVRAVIGASMPRHDPAWLLLSLIKC
jgi:hypothetical protein